MSSCVFDKAWIGPCRKPVAGDGVMCEEHARQECCSCGQPATRSCMETGQFVCGFPLCDECEHATAPDGSNGGVGFNAQKLPDGMASHCKKSEQRFEPWWSREEKP